MTLGCVHCITFRICMRICCFYSKGSYFLASAQITAEYSSNLHSEQSKFGWKYDEYNRYETVKQEEHPHIYICYILYIPDINLWSSLLKNPLETVIMQKNIFLIKTVLYSWTLHDKVRVSKIKRPAHLEMEMEILYFTIRQEQAEESFSTVK